MRQMIATALAIATPGIILTSCTSSDKAIISPEGQLLEILGPDIVKSIGKNWITQHANESNAEAIKKILLEGALWTSFDKVAIEKLSQYFQEKSQSEFKQFKTVLSDGWIVSETDCRLAALYYLNDIQKN